jgi:hypothetical protein
MIDQRSRLVFISATSSDVDFSAELAIRLSAAGFTIVSPQGMGAGDDLNDFVSKSLRQVGAVIFIISAAAERSSWLQYEVSTAVALSQRRGTPAIIPVVLDNEPIPYYLANYQVIMAPNRNVEQVANETIRALTSHAARIDSIEEERREVQTRIEVNVASYIENSLSNLKMRERRFRFLSACCYWVAGLELTLGFAYLVLGLLGALARFAFVLGRSYMVESIRNDDRSHAISFGKFYLDAFGEKADWNDVKEAFQYWNIDIGSSFSTQTASDIDPHLYQNMREMLSSASKAHFKPH